MMDRKMNQYDIMALVVRNRDYDALIREVNASLEMPKHLQAVAEEATRTLAVRDKLYPLLSEQVDARLNLQMAEGQIEGEIFLEFPPRKGSAEQREALRLKLRKESESYLEAKQELDRIAEEINRVNDEINAIEQAAKNGRRMIEMFKTYVEIINRLYHN